MNSDGIELLERLEQDPSFLKRIDQCAYFARTKKQIELIEFRKLLKPDGKNFAEPLMVHLLTRLVENLT